MSGSEFFTVGLQDKVTGPSQKMGRAALQLERQLARLERARQVKLRADLGNKRLSLEAERLRRKQSGLFGGTVKAPFKTSAGDVGGSLKGLSMTLAGLAVAASAATVAVGVKLGGAVVKTTDLALSSNLAFKALLGTAEKAEGFTNRSLTLANRYGMDLSETFGALRSGIATGFDRKQSEGILGMAADMRFLGASSEGVNRALLAINQIKAAGVLQGDELRQLSEVGGLDIASLYTRIGQRMGIVAKNGKSINEQVIKLKEAGKIDALTALNSLAEVIQSKTGMKLGEAGALAADSTLDGAWNKFATKTQTILFEVGREAGPNLLKGVKAVLGADTGETDVAMFLGLSKFVNDVGSFLERVGPKIPSIAENFTKAFGAASGLGDLNLNNFADRLPEIGTQLGQIAGNLVSITTSVAKLLGSSGTMNAVGTTIDIASGNLSNRFANSEGQKLREKRGFFGSIASVFTDPRNQGDAIGQGMASGIESSQRSAEQAATNLAKGVDNASRKELGIRSPADAFVDQGVQIDAGMAVGQLENGLAITAARGNARGTISASHKELARSSMSFSADTAAAAEALSRGRSSGASITVGDITIQVEGKGSAKETAQETLNVLEDQFGLMLEKLCQEIGA